MRRSKGQVSCVTCKAFTSFFNNWSPQDLQRPSMSCCLFTIKRANMQAVFVVFVKLRIDVILWTYKPLNNVLIAPVPKCNSTLYTAVLL